MEDSILKSVKKVLGLAPDYKAFDDDIVMHINTVFFDLHEIGIGPTPIFEISGDTETWAQFFGMGTKLNAVKTYVNLRVRLIFDPPATSFAIESMQKQIEKLEYRLNVHREGELHPWVEPEADPLPLD